MSTQKLVHRQHHHQQHQQQQQPYQPNRKRKPNTREVQMKCSQRLIASIVWATAVSIHRLTQQHQWQQTYKISCPTAWSEMNSQSEIFSNSRSGISAEETKMERRARKTDYKTGTATNTTCCYNWQFYFAPSKWRWWCFVMAHWLLLSYNWIWPEIDT